MDFPRSGGWTVLEDPTRRAVEDLVRSAPKTERLALRYVSDLGPYDEPKIPGMFEAARALPLRGLRLENLYAEHDSGREIRDYSDTAPSVCDLTAIVLPELAAASWLSLDTLEVFHAKDGLVATKALKGARCFQGLRRFEMEGLFTALPSWLRLPDARELVLASVRYEEKLVFTIIESAPKLELLWVDGFGPRIVKALRKSSFLPALRSLALPWTLAEDDAIALAGLGRAFEYLDLRSSSLSEKAVKALVESPSIAQCGTLDLRDNKIAAAQAARLREHLGARVKLDP